MNTFNPCDDPPLPSAPAPRYDTLYKVGFLDPAGKRKAQQLKKTAARAAIVVIGADELRRIFVLHAWCGKESAHQLAQRVIDLNDQFHCKQFGCEANAMQELFADMILHEAKQQGKRLPLVPIYQPTNVEKNWRIRTILQPVIGFGRLFLQENQVELRQEITSFPMSVTVDIIDALASAVAMVPARSAPAQSRDERDHLAAYLRGVGMPASQIDARLAELELQTGSTYSVARPVR